MVTEIKDILELEKAQQKLIIHLRRYRKYIKSYEEWRSNQGLSEWMGKIFGVENYPYTLVKGESSVKEHLEYTPDILSSRQKAIVENIFKTIWDRYEKDIKESRDPLSQNQDENQFRMKLLELAFGYCVIKFTNGDKEYSLGYDECLDDPFPIFASVYSALKEKSNLYSIGDEFEIIIININEDNVNLYIKVGYDRWYRPRVINEDISREKLIKAIENLFQEMLECPDFPHHFPCHTYHEGKKYNEVDDCVYETYKDKLNNEEFVLTLKKYIRENVPLNQEGEIFAEKFRNMLLTFKLPLKWI